MQIGAYQLSAPVALSPMAGITDKPFRTICRRLGAGWAVSEMITSDPSLQHTKKTQWRSNHHGEEGVIAVQIAGSDPEQMAQAARENVARGAQVIDINMGCPAKKVCNVLAGSALLQNEPLVDEILRTVAAAVEVPVTLKTRLGWDDEHQNLPTIAKMAEEAGIAALAVHGRTRTQMYCGKAQYDLIAQVKQEITMPLWVNGDITQAEQARAIMVYTGADGVMIGRGAQGRPWLFRDVAHLLQTGSLPRPLSYQACQNIALEHIAAIHDFYGALSGMRIARKHIGWYLAPFAAGEAMRKYINTLEDAAAQYAALAAFFEQEQQDFWPEPLAANPEL